MQGSDEHVLVCVPQDKEIYRWPIKESIKAMLAWEWTLEKARDGEGEVEKKAATRKISQTAQVQEETLSVLSVLCESFFESSRGPETSHEEQKLCVTFILRPGHVRSQPRLQPSANRHRRNDPVQRAAGWCLTGLIIRSDIYQELDTLTSSSSSCSRWPSSWLRTITTPGAGRRRWSYSPKVRGVQP